MSIRINMKNLESLLDTINLRAGFPSGTKLWTREGKSNKATVGMYSIDGAYGGWKLVKIDSESGGERTISNSGYTTKKQLYSEMRAFLSGMEAVREVVA